MDSLGVGLELRRTLVRCLAVLAVCFALNLISPVVIAAQRTIAPGETRLTTFDGPAELSVETTTSKGAKSGTVEIDANIVLDGAARTDSYTAAAASSMPVPGRGGVTYYFPYRPERRTYPYSDPFAPQTLTAPAALDYVGPGSVGGLDTYKYRARIATPDYAAERIIDLQTSTGVVLDETWSVERGPATGLFRMSEASRAEARAHAAGQVRVLHVLQVLAWVTRFIAVVALAWAAVAVARR
ncbi:porin PorA family protein [Corynebacterium mycetoides]|uniref:porin PorA family protein n=1 Tax=Corynebacterium mycetoides TaxID=38302 RepID=UPI0012FA8DFF|nr:porin PorA family protein [Corynebacterium mycetoides]